MAAEHVHDCPTCNGYTICGEDDCDEGPMVACYSCIRASLEKSEARVKALEEENTELQFIIKGLPDTGACLRAKEKMVIGRMLRFLGVKP